MEIRQYFLILRKWLWLLLLGAIVGGGIAYFFSTLQPTIYQTSTKFMVISSPEERVSSYYYTYNESQLAKSYSQMIATEQVLELLGERLGFSVGSGQINVKPVPDSSIIEITVRGLDPERVALIANSLVDVFIEYNDSLQNSRFAASEQTLQTQIDQVEEQISSLQAEMSQLSEQTLQEQQAEIEEQIAALETQIKPIRDEVEALRPTVIPPTPTPNLVLIDGRVTQLTPVPTQPLGPEAQALYDEARDSYAEKFSQLEQLESRLELYQQVYLNLAVFGETNLEGNQSARQTQLQSTLALYQQIYSNLLNSYESIRLARLRTTPNVVQIERARVPTTPIQPQPVRSATLGAAVGLLVMGALVVLVEYLDDTIKTPEDISRSLGLPVIGMIGEMEGVKGKDKKPGVYVIDNPRSPISEAFRTLRSNLDFAGVDKPITTLLVTSATPAEGKTTVAVNLAAVMAQGGKRIILLDTDLRRPGTHKHLGIPNRVGLSEFIRDPDHTFRDVKYDWDNPSFSVITSGALPPNPAELLGSGRMERILSDLSSEFDAVVIDGPPFLVTDPVVLSAKVDGVVIVIQPGHTKLDSARVMLEQLQMADARVVGVVLNPISKRRSYYYSGKYRYYSDYYHSRGYGYLSSGSKRQQGKTSQMPKTSGTPGTEYPQPPS